MSDHQDFIKRINRDAQGRSFHRLMDKFQIINIGYYIAAIPSDTPVDIVKGILAVMAAYSMDYKSVDYVMKKFGESWDEAIEAENKQEDLFNEISELIQKEVVEVINWVDDIDDKPGTLGLILANAAFVRLQSSFRTANLLIRLGYIFESAALCRMILEQIAWVYSIHEIEDDAVFKVSPSRAITKLKNLFPEVGNTYGFLNRFTHIEPTLVRQYISVKDSKTFEIRLTSTTNEVEEWGLFLLNLADYYSVIYEYIFRNLPVTFLRIERNSEDDFIPSDTRPINIAKKKYFDKLSKSE